MNNYHTRQLTGCLAMLQLQRDVRQAKTVEELGLIMVNRSQKILPATTTLFWQKNLITGAIKQASAVATVDNNAPFIIWANAFINRLSSQNSKNQVYIVNKQNLDPDDIKQWAEWLPPHGLMLPISSMDDTIYGWLFMVREEEWQPSDKVLAQELGQMYCYSWLTLNKQNFFPAANSNKLVNKWAKKAFFAFVIIIIVALFAVDVQQSVLAPATVMPHNPKVVTSPLDGVIKKIAVEANSSVKQGQILFWLEPSEIKNRRDVSKLVLQVTKERYLKAQKVAFSDPEARANLPLLESQIKQHTAEATYAQELLERTVVRAQNDGIAMFSNPSHWQGRPVEVGEQVMVIANANEVEVEISLAVDDAIIMQPGAEVLLFLNSDPLNPLPAKLHYASYQATVDQNGILAYRLTAKLLATPTPPRIGIQGTAKLLGPQTSIFYYLFRRPLTVLRQAVGF
ncbi:MAG: HlyD family efflux transporter periplasmic adaptor subunit [Magnetococcales bacterium]|nr:HlyD family efflux transporter periplasmic adaptor subunit [Magnetococcales bacterium]